MAPVIPVPTFVPTEPPEKIRPSWRMWVFHWPYSTASPRKPKMTDWTGAKPMPRMTQLKTTQLKSYGMRRKMM